MPQAKLGARGGAIPLSRGSSNPASVATAMASIAVTGNVVTKHYYFGSHRRWFASLDHTAQMPERATPCARLDKFEKREYHNGILNGSLTRKTAQSH